MIDQLRVLPSAALTPALLADSRTLVVHAPGTTPIDRVDIEGVTRVASMAAASDAPTDRPVVIDDWHGAGGGALPDRSSLAAFVEPWPLEDLLTSADDPVAVLDQFDAAYAVVDPVADAAYGPTTVATPDVTLDVPRTGVPAVEAEAVLTARGVDRALDATAVVPDLGVPVAEARDALASSETAPTEAAALAELLARSEMIDHAALADRLAGLTIAPGAGEAAERSLGLAPGTLGALPDAIDEVSAVAVDPGDDLDAILSDMDGATIDRVFDRLVQATVQSSSATLAGTDGPGPASIVETVDTAAALAETHPEPGVIAAATTALFAADLDPDGIRAGVARLVARSADDPDTRAAIAGEGLGRVLADRDATDREAALAGAIEAVPPSAWPAFATGVQTTADADLDASLVSVLVDRLVEAVDPVRVPPSEGVDAIADAVVTAATRSTPSSGLQDETPPLIDALETTAEAPQLALAVVEAVDRRFVTDATPDRAGDPGRHPLADRVLARTTAAILDAIGRGDLTATDVFAERLGFDHEPSTRRLYRAGLQALRDGDTLDARHVLRAAWERRSVLVPGTIDHDFALAAGAIYAGRLAVADHPGWPAEGVVAELKEEPGELPDGVGPVVAAIDDDRPLPDLDALPAEEAPPGSLDALEATVVEDLVDQLVDPPGPGEYFDMGCRSVIDDDARAAVDGFGSAWTERSAAETDADEWAAIAGGVAMLAHSRMDVISPRAIYQPAVAREVDTNRDLVPQFVQDVYDGVIADDTPLPDPQAIQAPVDLSAEPDREALARLAFARIVARLEHGGSELEPGTYPWEDDTSEADTETDADESDPADALVEGLETITAGEPILAIDPLLDAWDARRSETDPDGLIAGALLGLLARREGFDAIADEVVPAVRAAAADAPAVLDPVLAALDGDDPDVSPSAVREDAAALSAHDDAVADAVIAVLSD